MEGAAGADHLLNCPDEFQPACTDASLEDPGRQACHLHTPLSFSSRNTGSTYLFPSRKSKLEAVNKQPESWRGDHADRPNWMRASWPFLGFIGICILLAGVIYGCVNYSILKAHIEQDNMMAQQTAELNSGNSFPQLVSITVLSITSHTVSLSTGTVSTVTAAVYPSTRPMLSTFATKVRATVTSSHGDSHNLHTAVAANPRNTKRDLVERDIGGKLFSPKFSKLVPRGRVLEFSYNETAVYPKALRHGHRFAGSARDDQAFCYIRSTTGNRS